MAANVLVQSAQVAGQRRFASIVAPLAVAIAYYASAEAAFLIGTLSDRIYAPFWPPNVILFCGLLLTRRHSWPLIVGATFPLHVLAEVGVGMHAAQLVLAFATNVAVALLNAWSVQRFCGGPPWFEGIRKITAYITMTAGINPALVALGGAFVPIMGGGSASDYWVHWSNWYAGNALAALALGPIILAWSKGEIRRLLAAPLWRKLEAALYTISLPVTAVLSFQFAARASGSVFVPAILYLPLPIILWGSVRFGTRGASVAILTLTIASVSLTLNGPGPFLDVSPEKNVLALQLFLIGVAVPVLLLTAAVDQLRTAEQTTRALAGSILRAQDDERRRIARELHDSTGQNLIAASLLAGTFRSALREPGLAQLRKLEEVIQRATGEIRTLSYLLHPPSLDEGGLQSALPAYVAGFSDRSGINVALNISSEIGRLSTEAELALYRVVQESLGNVHRHSGSSTAHIRLRRRRDAGREIAVLTIEDRGRGFRSPHGHAPSAFAGARRGLGLESMRERMRQIGGRLEIESSPGKTVITAILPLTESPQATDAGSRPQ